MPAKPRPENSAILGVSMPLELKERIKRLAKAEERTMANWAAIKLREIVADLEAAKKSEPVKPDASPAKKSRDSRAHPNHRQPRGHPHA